MTITIPDDLLFASRMTRQEMATEVAVILYRRWAVPVEAAAQVAGMRQRQFAHLLASRGIPVDPAHFGVDERAAAEG